MPAQVACPPSWGCNLPRSTIHSHMYSLRNVEVSGEGRSANRAKWTVLGDGGIAPTSISPPFRHTSNHEQGTVEQTSIVDAPLLRNSLNEKQTCTNLIWDAVETVQPQFAAIDKLVHTNIARVQDAFRTVRVGPHHFAGSTGYGHGDLGRDALDAVMAKVMGAESAAVRIQFVSGTHAIASALYACLRPGDELLAVAGSPYDTLEEVIGLRGTPESGSLAEFGIAYRKLELASDGGIDWRALATAIKPGKDESGNALLSVFY